LSPARSSAPHDPHTKAAAVISRGQPTVVHINIVSPLARLVCRDHTVGDSQLWRDI
jgi:hypothetical protein